MRIDQLGGRGMRGLLFYHRVRSAPDETDKRQRLEFYKRGGLAIAIEGVRALQRRKLSTGTRRHVPPLRPRHRPWRRRILIAAAGGRQTAHRRLERMASTSDGAAGVPTVLFVVPVDAGSSQAAAEGERHLAGRPAATSDNGRHR